MEFVIRGWKQLSNKQLIKKGYKPRLNYELVEKDGKKSEHLKCHYCGKQFIYDFSERDRFIKEGRWNFRKDRPEHCGNSTCADFVQDVGTSREKHAKELFESLLQRGFCR